MIALGLSSIAALFLGLLAGSLLLEGLVLVPFFKKLKPEEFFSFHPIFGQQLFRYFAPLTSLAVFVPIISAIWLGGTNICLDISATASLIVVLFFPFYFKSANEAFSNRLVSAKELPNRLAQWGKIHTIRTVVAMAAFGSGVLGVHAIN